MEQFVLFFIYLKLFITLGIIFFSGIHIYRRGTDETRPQILIPGGIVLGIALYIFIVNVIAHFFKGPPVFFISLLIQLLIGIVLKKTTTTELTSRLTSFEKKLWFFSALVWGVFLFIITGSGHANSGDASSHYILASLLIRGDYPIHSPYQPDFLAYYHIGGAQLLGAFKSITGGSFEFLFSVFSFIFLFALSQILSWIVPTNLKSKKLFFLIFLIPALGIVSLGQFMFAWPIMFSFPNVGDGWVRWIGQLPIFGAFGASTSLDNFSLFFHRVLSMSFFIALLPIILLPKNKYKLLVALLTMIVLAAIALTDEAVLVIVLGPALLFCLFTVFRRSIFTWGLFCALTVIVILVQGGIITDSLLSPNLKTPQVLVLPEDETGPLAYYYQYRSYRVNTMKSYSYDDNKNYHPFKFTHPGILEQLILFFLMCLAFQIIYKGHNFRFLKNLLWLLLACSIISLIAFHVIVPAGIYHINGSRFLGLSFHLSGIGIACIIYYLWINLKFKKPINFFAMPLKIALVWILAFSILPPLAQLFPRNKIDWFVHKPSPMTPLFSWIKNNIPVEKRIVMLTETFPGSSANTELVTKVGTLTPLWTSDFYVHGFDTNPTFSDLFYTLNPKIISRLKIDYLVIGDEYLDNIVKYRVTDIKNEEYFQPIFRDDSTKSTIFTVKQKYISEAKNLNGTFEQLSKIAPKEGAYWMEDPPNIAHGFHRSLRLVLADRQLHYNMSVSAYNFVFDVQMKYYGGYTGKYNYLILNKNTNPKDVCSCEAKLLWEGLGNDIKLWQTI